MDPRGNRIIVYLDGTTHQALRSMAAVTSRTLSDVVNEAVKQLLLEDAEDLAAFDERATEEPSLPFEEVARKLRRRGSRVPRP